MTSGVERHAWHGTRLGDADIDRDVQGIKEILGGQYTGEAGRETRRALLACSELGRDKALTLASPMVGGRRCGTQALPKIGPCTRYAVSPDTQSVRPASFPSMFRCVRLVTRVLGVGQP